MALSNGNRPKDETLPAPDQIVLERCILPTTLVLRLIGHGLDSLTEPAKATRTTRVRRRYFTAVKDLIDTGLLKPGDRLVSTNRKWPAEAVVLADGRIEYKGCRTIVSPRRLGRSWGPRAHR